MKVNPEMIVRSALALLNEIGLEQLTLRRLALELHIQAPTLYWHFKSKEELIDAMATMVLAEGLAKLLPARKRGDWRVWAMTFGDGLRKTLLTYRDGARMVAGTRLTDLQYLQTTEKIGRQMLEFGFTVREAVVLFGTIYHYTVSFVMEEQALFPAPGERAPYSSMEARNARLDAGEFAFHRQTTAILFDGYERRFKEGLKLIVKGAEGRV